MDLNSLVYSPKLLFTPRLRQAINIIEMSSQELFEFAERQSEENPVLEFKRHERNPCENGCIFEMDRVSDHSGFYSSRTSLKEHLLFQLRVSEMGAEPKSSRFAIAEHLIDNVDDNGYLNVDTADVAEYFNIPVREVKAVLRRLQSFDPPGVCARNLQECLKIQLRNSGYLNRDMLYIINHHLDDMANKRFDYVARATGLTVEKIREFFDVIKQLEPKPGREFFNSENTGFIVPDLIVNYDNGSYNITVNKDSIPQLCINRFYKNLLSEKVDTDVRKFLLNKMSNAHWIIKCLQLRKNALNKLASYIAREQAGFFSCGKSHLKLLDPGETMKRVNLNEFLFLKLLNGKYLQCAWGHFELRCFFSNVDRYAKTAGY